VIYLTYTEQADRLSRFSAKAAPIICVAKKEEKIIKKSKKVFSKGIKCDIIVGLIKNYHT